MTWNWADFQQFIPEFDQFCQRYLAFVIRILTLCQVINQKYSVWVRECWLNILTIRGNYLVFFRVVQSVLSTVFTAVLYPVSDEVLKLQITAKNRFYLTFLSTNTAHRANSFSFPNLAFRYATLVQLKSLLV